MKTRIVLLIAFLCVLFFPSCYDPTDNEYSRQEYETEIPFSDWKLDYQYVGVLNTPIDDITNILVGTKWVLTEYRVGFAPVQHPYDTIEFITNRTYTINNGGIRSYNLFSSTMSTNYELTLNYFFPFGGSHYSTQIGEYSVDDGEINNALFIDLQNSNLEIIAYFTKIN